MFFPHSRKKEKFFEIRKNKKIEVGIENLLGKGVNTKKFFKYLRNL